MAATAQQLKKVRWVERAYSLWAPVTVFGVAFALYLIIEENSVCSYLWLQPLLKGFGLVCLAAWAVLVGLRTMVKPFKALRGARHVAEELTDEVDALRKKHRQPENVRDDLDLLQRNLHEAMIGNDAAAIREGTARLDAAVDKHFKAQRKGGVFDFGSGFVKALLVALLIRSVLLEPFKIPSGSMIPTLEIGDQIFVNKFIYGVRIPFTNFVPFQIVRAPRRGDVIVFNNPVQPDKDFVKRIVGIPGDRIEIEGRSVKINGTELPRTIEAASYESWDQGPSTNWNPNYSALARETLDGVPHYTLHHETARQFGRNPITVPEKSVFVMGDNRDNSEDSRYGLGMGDQVQFVPYGSIKGKAMVIWIALGHGGLLSSVFGGTGLRTDRFFLPVTMCGTEAPRPSSP